jgi:hypothetical protein
LEFFTRVEKQSPEFVEDAFLLSTSEGAIDADIVSELFGEDIPLASCSEAIDNAITGFALVYAGSPHARRRVVFGENGGKKCP